MWLLRDGDVLAALEAPRKGWQSSLSGAVILTPPAVVQTFTRAAAVDLDAAWCAPATLDNGSAGYEVKRIVLLSPRRLTFPRLGGGALIVASGGSFERWHLKVGDCLEVRGA